MRYQLLGACLLALTSMASAAPDVKPKRQYLWGEDQGKMVKRATSKHVSSSTSTKHSTTSSTKHSTTSTSSTKAVSSSTKATSSSTTAISSAAKVASSSTSSAASSTSLVADSACSNSALTRSCWSDGYSIATDFDQKHPTTGKTVSYTLEVTNTTCNPDGNADQPCYLVNGQYPGPTIYADWGDTLEITVKNSMQSNGTSMHWHGIRQLGSNGADGVNGLTECPTPPGQSTTYTFLCTQFGSSWYHSHHSSQYGLGVFGGIVINGPASGNYDIDLGTFMVNDWFYQDAWVANQQTLTNLQAEGQPPAGNNVLVNGSGMSASGSGNYAEVTITPNKKHRLRLVNPSVDNFMYVKLDGHPFEVISADFIPVEPLAGQDWIMLGIGQRYDVVFTGNATPGTYYFRAEVATGCLSANDGKGRALFTYEGETVSAPTDSDETPPTACADVVTTPYWKQAVDESTFASQYSQLTTDLTQEQVTTNGANLVLWALNQTAMNIDWAKPTLGYLFNGSTAFPAEYDVIEIPNEGVWTYWVVQTLQATVSATEIAAPPPPHPIHLHGHDFFVLGQGSGQFSGSTTDLNFANPPRRDTTTLPSDGWLAIAFSANNPGSWLMHCHIAWHISEGLGVQFLEAKDQIVMPDQTAFEAQCANWAAFQANMPYPKYDSGL